MRFLFRLFFLRYWAIQRLSGRKRGGFASVVDLQDAGGYQFVEALHDEVGDVELEAGAFEFDVYHADAAFNSRAILFFGVIRVKLQL
jgi:hypothetical protein